MFCAFKLPIELHLCAKLPVNVTVCFNCKGPKTAVNIVVYAFAVIPIQSTVWHKQSIGIVSVVYLGFNSI